MRPKPFVLIIMDGWALGSCDFTNAISAARTPTMDLLYANFSSAELIASGEAVGLPKGQMGNSEVGHLNIGAGRIVYQDLTRINLAIKKSDFFENPVLKEAFKNVKKSNSQIHLIGLVSDGGVHSHINHLFALLEMAKKNGVENVVVHAFLDGRDTPPQSAVKYLKDIEKKVEEIGVGCIATVSGRYYAMDRDKRWERTKKAYDALVHGEGEFADDAISAVEKAYERGETDEFVFPTIIEGCREKLVKFGDSIVFFNFRPDRARQLTRAFTEKGFNNFNRGKLPLEVHFVCLTEYDATFDLPVAFPPERMKNILADVLAKNNLKQLRIAETEKYAHVTFFFNGGEETPRPFEDRILIPSPKVATYDLKPEMSAYEVTNTVVDIIDSDKYDFILINFANPDMVGHTGNFDAAVRAIEVVDECVGRIVDTVIDAGGELIVTSDHGNADLMVDTKTRKPRTAHTANAVPFIFVSKKRKPVLRKQGILADVAPTILVALEIKIPKEMTGKPMFDTINKFDVQ